jgi:hypothetical protein
MPRPPAIVNIEKHLRHHLNNTGINVISPLELIQLFNDNYRNWSLPFSTSATKHIEKLVKRQFLKELTLQVGRNSITRYIYKEPSIYEISLSLKSKSYISHYPALQFNQLTTQIPKTIYTTHELSPKATITGTLIQTAIDAAFRKPQRRSGLEVVYDDYKIILLEGKYSKRSGVITENNISYTNLERTLLDVTVRPNYAGGAFSVLEAYQIAVDRDLSINKLNAYLTTLDFIYPYHQAIGFYLEKAGMPSNRLDLLRKKPMHFKFYLEYEMTEMEYNADWKIYYPKGL